LPERLLGADFVQAAKADRACSAVDLMELAVPAGAVVTIAHDDRLPVPAWMSKLFEPTGDHGRWKTDGAVPTSRGCRRKPDPRRQRHGRREEREHWAAS
jgi:hypothetical protein